MGRRRTLIVLDAVAGGLTVATYLQLAPPELLFHGVFVVLTIDAFVYGLRVCLTRIVAVSVAMLGYVALPAFDVGVEPLDLTEWPLMFTIAILVAVMADRERTAARRYAVLYERARDRLVGAQEEERRRLSRDLHDGIGQTLTALTLALEAARGPVRQAELDRARALAVSALDDVRFTAEWIRPPRLEERGLASAIHELAHRSGFVADIGAGAEQVQLSPDQVLEIYRIAQEALGNAMRHARATTIKVTLECGDSDLRLGVIDDGIGIADGLSAGPGLGLTDMQERARVLGAELSIQPRSGGGTAVALTVPLRAQTASMPGVEPPAATLPRGQHS